MKNLGIIITLSLVVFFYYFAWGLVFESNGYYNPEALFLIEKSLLALKGNPPRLENIGLVYPPVPFFVLFPFVLFNPFVAPIFASSFFMSLLTAFVVYRILKKNLSFIFIVFLLLILFLNPVILYVASSGSSSYLYLTFLSLFYIFIFEYYERNVSFYLAIAGVFIGFLVFVRYEIVFMLIFWILVNAVLAIETTLEESVSYKNFFELLGRLPAYRQTFIRKMFAIYLMIFIPPIIGFSSWCYLNWLFTSNPFHFINSPYSYFRTLSTYVLYNPTLLELKGNIFKSTTYVLQNVLIYMPAYIVLIFVFLRRFFFSLALITPITALIITSYLGLSLMNVDFFVPFIFIAFIAMIYACEERPSLRRNAVMLVFGMLIFISFFTGYYKLRSSFYPEEKNFAKILIGENLDGLFAEEKKVAEFLKQNTSLEDNILMDDAVAFPIVVFHGEPKNFILPYQYEFTSVIEQPAVYADYVVIYNPEKFEGKRDLINQRHQNLFFSGSKDLLLVYSYGNWRVFQSVYRKRILTEK
ncbi:hypothetical protein [Candidatus Kryptobacter tengchongensis]|uniref:Dolichyl-phosphate-mannose-protein mannosyltransferase n=1 Tax=Kryptobacter tengchongensis TaxID=1643429 RepID=A0A916PEK3_KRYT1|nr:hypothetical protein [Candidatus Kryptobacter tengchongensis]CUT03001.1 Dolichyl-phosphate-mannose-protein mannosyltransferase [Candidatus Kryptobacter tengchongensis]